MDFQQFSHLTFDCYGTLIDWESGILDALLPMVKRHNIEVTEPDILRLHARFEAELEAGPYTSYRHILTVIVDRMGQELGFEPTAEDLCALAESVPRWQPFPDTTESLAALGKKHRLVILSNIDDFYVAHSLVRIGVPFDEVITAEQVQSYKPGQAHFGEALERLGVPREKILHVAQSPYHDHVPAKALGFSTAWINRPSRLPNTGLSLPVEVTPDLEVSDLKGLVAAMTQ